ncbi:uncharacterized protein LOC115217880 [Octopus sinensis]|uniref:Uncharacterized protein LOC115217880 n=1 Tax=Octopus sinensis TaxID=2607531 RepID=A0A6P7SZ68_9MOLL|nr:uncharacterized protein LOC115217880 [Octopus sinensis]
MHSQPSIDSKSAEKKPEVITCYNKIKGGVDTLDKMVRTYICKRVTRRWPMGIFYNMIDISAVNTFIVAKHLHLQSFKDKRIQCLIQLGKGLAGINAKQEHDKQSSSSANISQPNKKRKRSSISFEIPQPKQKGRCSLCGPKINRKSRTTCKYCNIHVCQEHSNVVCIHCHEEL